MSYLIMPVQRIPRYELLLKELRRTIEAERKEHQAGGQSKAYVTELSTDIEQLDEALSKVQAIAQHVNEQKRKAEQVAALQSVQRRIEGMDKETSDIVFTSQRQLIKEGDLQKNGTLCLVTDTRRRTTHCKHCTW
jgi:hypothetical protein